MSATLQIDFEQTTHVQLTTALLVYRHVGYDSDETGFITVHDVEIGETETSLGPGTLLDRDTLKDIVRVNYRTQMTFLPPQVLASTPETLVWHEPARKRVMFFRGSDPYLNALSGQMFPQPPLLFAASGRQLHVFALGSDARPTLDSPLFTAPYYNVTSGTICLGSTVLPDQPSPSHTGSYSAGFFASEFTHGTRDVLVTWGGSYGEFWSHVAEAGQFPLERLNLTGKRLGDLFHA